MNAHQVRRFHLERAVDVSGISGTGVVAFGVQAPNGTCVLWWDSEYDSIGIYPSIDILLAIHGHSGSTQAVFLDDPASGAGAAAGRGVPQARSAVAVKTVTATKSAAPTAAGARARAKVTTNRAGGAIAPGRAAGRAVRSSRPVSGAGASSPLPSPAAPTRGAASG